MQIIVTAGPTREYLDPVRFLSNPSTGKMGFAIAVEAARRGHKVTLIAGPVALKTPDRVHRVDITSAREMLSAVETALADGRKLLLRSLRTNTCASFARTSATSAVAAPGSSTVLISTAAVADWRPAKCATKKLKKGEMSGVLKLVRNPDILKTIARQVGGRRSRWTVDGRCLLRLVGFAAETDHVLAEAARKCREKGLSFIVANDVTRKGCGFGTDTNKVTFVFPDGTQRNFPLMTKRMVAKRILEEIENED